MKSSNVADCATKFFFWLVAEPVYYSKNALIGPAKNVFFLTVDERGEYFYRGRNDFFLFFSNSLLFFLRFYNLLLLIFFRVLAFDFVSILITSQGRRTPLLMQKYR